MNIYTIMQPKKLMYYSHSYYLNNCEQLRVNSLLLCFLSLSYCPFRTSTRLTLAGYFRNHRVRSPEGLLVFLFSPIQGALNWDYLDKPCRVLLGLFDMHIKHRNFNSIYRKSFLSGLKF